MDSPVSPKDEIRFLRVCHHISTGLWCAVTFQLASGVPSHFDWPLLHDACFKPGSLNPEFPENKAPTTQRHVACDVIWNKLSFDPFHGKAELCRFLANREWQFTTTDTIIWLVFINYIWLDQLSNTTNLWWIDVYYLVINYMFRRLWPSSCWWVNKKHT